MFEILKKLLASEGGWISGAMMLGSMIGQGVMNSKKSKGLKASGVEFGYRDQAQDFGDRMRGEQAGIIDPVRGMTMGGLAGALPDIYSQRPNSSQFDAVAAQQRQLENKARATGARGGLLRNQMFEAAKAAAQNKLAITENARQNALQRAFQTALPMMPTTSSDYNKEVLGERFGSNIVNTELARKLPAQAAQQKDSAGMGAGLGSIMGGMDFSGLLSGITGLFGNGATFMPGSATGYEGGFF